jgi:hypothetical protein
MLEEERCDVRLTGQTVISLFLRKIVLTVPVVYLLANFPL